MGENCLVMLTWVRLVGETRLVMLAWVRAMRDARLVMLSWVSRPFIRSKICSGHVVFVVSHQASDGMMARSCVFYGLSVLVD